MEYKWKFDACIYRKADGGVLYSEICDTYEEAQTAIEENIDRFLNEDYPPTGHINKEYVQVD